MSIKNASFLLPKQELIPTVVITGVCRSGKTTIGNILATCNEVEYVDEPVLVMQLPIVAKTEHIDKKFALSWMYTNVLELMNDTILLRNANFRPKDLSSIWNKKGADEIFERLININSRQEARELAAKNKSSLVLTLSQTMPFMDFITEAIPGVKVVHVVRNPFKVAADVVKKGWFSDQQLINPIMPDMYVNFNYKNSLWYLPWWVDEGEYDYFIELSENERALYYWWSLISKGQIIMQKLNQQPIVVKYDDFLLNPYHQFELLSEKLGFTYCSLTKQKLNEIDSSNVNIEIGQINPLILQRVESCLSKL
jgi:hypothetical protein